MSTVPPIRREIIVDADPAAAFEVFTAGLGQWWPLEELSVHGKGATVAFADGQIVERAAGGARRGGRRLGHRHPLGAADRGGVHLASRPARRARQPRRGHLRRPRHRPSRIRPRLAAGP